MMLKRMMLGALMASFASGCGGDAAPSQSPEIPNEELHNSDAPDDLDDEVDSTPPALCIGLNADDNGSCAPTPTGPNACTSDNCAPLIVEMGCLDKDNSGYHDDVDESTLLVDSSWALYGGGDGTEDNPFGSIAEALAVAVDGDTIALARNDASYRESIEVTDFTDLTLLGPGHCDGKASVIIHGESADATIHLVNSPGAHVEGFEIRGNGIGVHIEGDANGTYITGNKLFQNGGDGIRFTDWEGADAEVSGNLIRSSLGAACGVRLQGGSGGVIRANEIRNIVGPGICAVNIDGLSIDGNSIHSNQSVGLALQSTTVDVTNNTIRENSQGGILIQAAGEGTTAITGNRLEDNGDFGVLYDPAGTASPSRDVEFAFNLIRSEANAPQSIGLIFPGESAGFTVSNSEIEGMSGPGILVKGENEGVPSITIPSETAQSQIARNVIRNTGVAGVHISGVLGIVLSDNTIEGITSVDGTDVADGVIGIESALRIQRGSLRDCVRFGAAFQKSKAALTNVALSGNGDEVGCTDPACATVQHAEGSPTPDVELLPNEFQIPSGDGFIPTP
jgi:nitrous oxidase accessory protein NosD